MADQITFTQPSHIPMSTLWDRQRELFANQLCVTTLYCARLGRRYYYAAKNGNFGSIRDLGDGSDHYFKKLSPGHYQEPLEHLLKVEEAYNALENRRYDWPDARIKLMPSTNDDGEERGQLVQLQYTGLQASGLLVYPGDQIVLKHNDNCYHVEPVNRVKGDIIRTRVIQGSPPACYLTDKPKFTIIFCPSGVPTWRRIQALRFFKEDESRKQLLKQMLFDFDNYQQLKNELRKTRPKIVIEDHDHNNNNNNKNNDAKLPPATLEELEQSLARCNLVQRSAISNILAGRCRPKPYILFGPPGTGKTKTLVECVIQAHLRKPDFSILVCVSSNTCANHLADLLDKSELFSSQTMVRLMPQHRFRELDDALVREYYIDDAKTDSKVVVTTNIKAGSIRHRLFDYVFIDEAGHAMEPEALIPATKLKSDGVLVLSGDPKQLRPVVKQNGVSDSCLRESMLERLYKRKLYSEHRDKNYITILSDSYRSDARLMALWSRMFYENTLTSKGPETPQSLLDEFKLKNNPIAFRSNPNPEAHITMSSSRWNESEVDICLDLVTKLRKHVRPEQIGIISMYKLQAKKIQKALLDRLYDLAISRPQRVDGDFVPYRRKRRSKKRKNLQQQQQQQQQPAQETDSPEESWLEFERMVVEMRRARFAGGRNQTAASTSTNRVTSSSTETTPSGTTNDDLPLLVDTVDAFQGNEREVIIISTVRSDGYPGGYRFIYDPRRFNVAISRAKWLLIAVGNLKVLRGGMHWAQYIKQAQEI